MTQVVSGGIKHVLSLEFNVGLLIKVVTFKPESYKSTIIN